MKSITSEDTLPLLVRLLRAAGLPKIAARLAKHCAHLLAEDNPLLSVDLLALLQARLHSDKSLRKKYRKF